MSSGSARHFQSNLFQCPEEMERKIEVTIQWVTESGNNSNSCEARQTVVTAREP